MNSGLRGGVLVGGGALSNAATPLSAVERETGTDGEGSEGCAVALSLSGTEGSVA